MASGISRRRLRTAECRRSQDSTRRSSSSESSNEDAGGATNTGLGRIRETAHLQSRTPRRCRPCRAILRASSLHANLPCPNRLTLPSPTNQYVRPVRMKRTSASRKSFPLLEGSKTYVTRQTGKYCQFNTCHSASNSYSCFKQTFKFCLRHSFASSECTDRSVGRAHGLG